MSKQIANQIDIERAAETLLGKGVPINSINSDLIRKEIGGGSHSTIIPILNEWRARRLNEVTIQIPVPDAVHQSANSFIKDLWHQALRSSKEHYQHLEEKLDNLESEKKGLLEEIEELRTEIEAREQVIQEKEQLTKENQCRFVGIIRLCSDNLNRDYGRLDAILESSPNSEKLKDEIDRFVEKQKQVLSQALDDQNALLSEYLNKERGIQVSAVEDGISDVLLMPDISTDMLAA